MIAISFLSALTLIGKGARAVATAIVGYRRGKAEAEANNPPVVGLPQVHNEIIEKQITDATTKYKVKPK